MIKSLDAQKRKMRLEEMAQRKRPVKQYQTSLQIKSKTERISRNMESRKNVKVNKSRYAGDPQNIWQIRYFFYYILYIIYLLFLLDVWWRGFRGVNRYCVCL